MIRLLTWKVGEATGQGMQAAIKAEKDKGQILPWSLQKGYSETSDLQKYNIMLLSCLSRLVCGNLFYYRSHRKVIQGLSSLSATSAKGRCISCCELKKIFYMPGSPSIIFGYL